MKHKQESSMTRSCVIRKMNRVIITEVVTLHSGYSRPQKTGENKGRCHGYCRGLYTIRGLSVNDLLIYFGFVRLRSLL